MEKIRIGIVGAGNIAANAHMPAYAVCDKAEVVAVADLNLERAQSFAKRFGIPNAYASVEDMLAAEQLDAVDVCTWNNGHAPVTIAAAKHYLQGKGAVRVHGGGFAGTAQAFVPVDMLADFKAQMEAILGEGRCHVLSIRPEGGAVL